MFLTKYISNIGNIGEHIKISFGLDVINVLGRSHFFRFTTNVFWLYTQSWEVHFVENILV